MASGFVDLTAGPRQESGAEGIKQVWARIWAKYPDIRIVVEDMLGEGDKIVVRLTFQRISSSGNQTIGSAIEIFRIAGGKIVQLWNILNLV